MNTRITASFALTALMAWSSSSHAALPGESISLDPGSGNYTITYCSPVRPCALQQAVFVPSTKINPLLKSTFNWGQRGASVSYRYRVTNGFGGKQPLISFALTFGGAVVGYAPLLITSTTTDADVIENLTAGAMALSGPEAWSGLLVPLDVPTVRASWSLATIANGTDGVRVGRRLNGFGFTSKDLPGIAMAEFQGNAGTMNGYANDEGPSGDLLDQVGKLQSTDFVSRLAVVPTISVGSPFSAASVLGEISSHARSLVSIQLLDPAFFDNMNRYLQAAIDAANRGNIVGVRSNLTAVRALLSARHRDLDDDVDDDGDDDQSKCTPSTPVNKMVVRVLKFDIAFVDAQLR